MTMTENDPPKKRGRPKVDPETRRRIVERYENEESITQIALHMKIARVTVARIIEDEYGYDFVPHKPIDQPDTPPPEPPDPPGGESATEMDKTYKTIRKIEGNQPSDPPTRLGQIQQELAQFRKDLRGVEREYALIGRGEGGNTDVDPTDVSGLKAQLQKVEDNARSVLEAMGFKVAKTGEPTTVEEAKEYLQGQGYQITDPRLSREDFEKQVEKVKEEMATEWQIKLDEASEDRRIEAGENIIAIGIDRVCAIFEPIIGQAIGVEVEKTVQRKRTAQDILGQAREMRARASSPDKPMVPPVAAAPAPIPPKPAVTAPAPYLIPVDRAKAKGKK